MCAALQLVLACVALARVLPARCHDATLLETPQPDSQCDNSHCDNEKYFPKIKEANSRCDEDIIIEVESDPHYIEEYSSKYDKNQNEISIPYGPTMTVKCSGWDGAILALSKDGKELMTDNYNGEIVKVIENPDLQISKYVCSDVETECEWSIVLTVKPALEVISQDIQPDDEYTITYTIQYGNSLLVKCSGPTAARLTMMRDGENLPTENIGGNITIIKWFAIKPDLQISEYVCIDEETTMNTSVIIRVEPKVYVQSRNEIVPADHFNSFSRTHVYHLAYVDSVEVFCFGPRPVAFIDPEKDYKEIENVYVNATTIKAFIRNILGTTVFTCIDAELPNYKSRVRIKVELRIQVTSPNIRQVNDMYVVKYDDPLEIFCSGPDAKELTMFTYYGITRKLELYTVNETTIKWVIDKLGAQVFNAPDHFVCSTESEEDDTCVEVDILPEVVNFGCVSHNLLYLNCTWIAVSYKVSFTLSYMQNGKPIPICVQNVTSPGPTFCVWRRTHPTAYRDDIDEFSFKMKSCNELGCYTQTFLINQLSIVKLAPPQAKVQSKSSHGALLEWHSTYTPRTSEGFVPNDYFEHKVEYWFSGTKPVEANSSLATCVDVSCGIELRLPCSGQFYEVRIYQKLRKAIGEEFWSDPSIITFHTDVENDNTDDADAICNLEPIETVEVVKYFMYKLKNDVRLKLLQFKKVVRSLKQKRDRIRGYLSQHRQTDEL